MPPHQISDPRRDLQIHANRLNLSTPVYKMYSKKEKNSAKITIYASVKVQASYFSFFFFDVDKYINFAGWCTHISHVSGRRGIRGGSREDRSAPGSGESCQGVVEPRDNDCRREIGDGAHSEHCN